MRQSSLRMSRAALAVFCVLAFGCTESSKSQSGNRQEVRNVATESVKLRMQKKPDDIKEVVAPRQKEDIDFSTLDSEMSAEQEALFPYISVSADTSVLQEGHGYVLVSIERPDPKKMMRAVGMGFSERRSLARTVENGEPAVVKSRIDELIENAKESRGSVPTSKERTKIPVLKSDEGEWKAVLRSQLSARIEDGRDAVERSDYGGKYGRSVSIEDTEGDWEKARSTLQYALDLAPSLDLTHDFASEVISERVERAGKTSRRSDLQKAEETLEKVKEKAPQMKTEDLSNQIEELRKRFTYASSDSVEVRVSSAKIETDGYGNVGVDLSLDIDVQNNGEKTIRTIYTDFEASLETEGGSLVDTTFSSKMIIGNPMYRGGELSLKPGDTESKSKKETLMRVDREKLQSAQLSISNVEVTPLRVEGTLWDD